MVELIGIMIFLWNLCTEMKHLLISGKKVNHKEYLMTLYNQNQNMLGY